MQVTKEQTDPCKMALTITVEPEKVKAARSKAFAQAAQYVQLPGFRKGKVPPQMARAYVDEGRVRQHAAEALIGPAYAEALEEAQVEAFAGLNPEIDLVEFPDDGPLVFKAFVPLRPVITLGPYKGIDLEQRRVIVTDADVDKQIEDLMARHAEYPEIVDRETETGDVILADLLVRIEGQETPEFTEPRATVIEIGKNIPDLDAALVGMTIGETKTIETTYPEEYADEKLRGKQAAFTVKVNEIRSRILPEMNEEFIQKVRPTAHTEEELRTQLREALETSASEMSDNDLEFDLVTQVVKTSQIFFPEALLRAEMQSDIGALNERLKRENASFEQYLNAIGKTAQQVEAEMAQAADHRIRNSLALSEIARTEEIEIDDADVEAQINDRAERAKVSPAAVRAFLEKNNQLVQVRDQALTEKILDFLKSESHITERTMTREELEALNAASPEATDEAAAATEFDSEAEASPLMIEEAGPQARKSKTAEEVVEETAAEDDSVVAA